jgi:hypothetical protein
MSSVALQAFIPMNHMMVPSPGFGSPCTIARTLADAVSSDSGCLFGVVMMKVEQADLKHELGHSS